MTSAAASSHGTIHESERSSNQDDPIFDVAAQQCFDRAFEALYNYQQAETHWVGTLSSSALATAMALVALQLVDPVQYAEPIRRGREWLLATQAVDGGWGDAVVDPTNINATSLAIGALTFTAPATGGTWRLGGGRRSQALYPQWAGSYRSCPGRPDGLAKDQAFAA
jgi:squalene cyclase